jgi:hypothetical protein
MRRNGNNQATADLISVARQSTRVMLSANLEWTDKPMACKELDVFVTEI